MLQQNEFFRTVLKNSFWEVSLSRRLLNEFFRTVLKNSFACAVPYAEMQTQLTDRVMSRHDEEAPDPGRSVLIAFVRESTLAVYRQWIADGKRLTPTEVADLAVALVCRGTEGYNNASKRG